MRRVDNDALDDRTAANAFRAGAAQQFRPRPCNCGVLCLCTDPQEISAVPRPVDGPCCAAVAGVCAQTVSHVCARTTKLGEMTGWVPCFLRPTGVHNSGMVHRDLWSRHLLAQQLHWISFPSGRS